METWFKFFLLLRFVLLATGAKSSGRVNDTCVGTKLDNLHKTVYDAFEKVVALRSYPDAQIMSYTNESVEVMMLFSRGDLRRNRHMSFKQNLRVTKHEDLYGYPRVEKVGRPEDISNVLFLDVHKSGQTAQIFYEEGNPNEQFLMVNTSNAKTSCTLRLSMYNLHGRVLTDDVFGFFKFSPDGKYIMYMAESPADPAIKYVYRGDFGEMVEDAVRPIVILYEVATLQFKTINHIPEFYSVGQISWKPDSTGIIGVAWYNHPFPMACPDCANRNSKIFTTDLIDDSENAFVTLTPSNLHVYAPRLTLDGHILVYLENDLSTYDEEHLGHYIIPGTQKVSRRLMKMNFTNAVALIKRAGNLKDELDFSDVVVKQVYYPFEQHDGTTFSGLYPKLPLPLRCFSHDGSMFYMSIYAKAALRLVAVNINTKQVSFHPQKDVQLLDVTDDALLVAHGSLQDSPSLRLGTFHTVGHGQTSTTIPYGRPTTVSPTGRPTGRPSRPTYTPRPSGPTATTTYSGLPTTTLYDPCEHLLQEIEEKETADDEYDNEDEYDDSNGNNSGHGGNGNGNGGNYGGRTTTTSHPFATPLPVAYLNLYNITAFETQDMNVEILEFESENSRGHSMRGRPGQNAHSGAPETFSAVYAVPNTLSGRYIPLVVDIHGGPHDISTTSFQHRAKIFLQLGFAVLSINYRGSIGNGDYSLYSILGNIFKNELDDVHLAINKTLTQKHELDNNRVVLLGDGFGGFIASFLNIRYPDMYSTLVLTNPMVDLGALSSNSDVPDLAWQLLGLNYTVKSLPSDVGDLAWEKSPLNHVDGMSGKTLIFVGDDNTIIVPESQGIALYKALHHRGVEPALYHYPETGNTLESLEVRVHALSKTLLWIHSNWATYNELCQYKETTTMPTTTPYASSQKPGSSSMYTTTTKGGTTGSGGATTGSGSHGTAGTGKPHTSSATTMHPMSGQYISGAIVLLMMHIFTLGVWVQFKI